MAYRFTVTVAVEVERTEGLFASRDEIAEQLQDAVENADYGQWDGDNGGVYETTGWEVEVGK